MDMVAAGGRPDGCTVDAEGFLWIAEPDSSCVRRYDPDGRCEREIVLPVTRPSSCTFGGPNYDLLFITTLRIRLDEAQLAAQPLAGSLFVASPGVRGIPEPLFAG
jgi:sugar lactone lactonase YvrE